MDYSKLFNIWIQNLRKSKLGKKLQFEPHILKADNYINPQSNDKILVIYPEADYLKPIFLQTVSKDNYYSMDILKDNPSYDIKFDKIVFFFVIHMIDENFLHKIKQYLNINGFLYVISYLKNSAFFNVTLKLIDRSAYNIVGNEEKLFKNSVFILSDKTFFKKQHIAIYKYSFKLKN